jgi:glyoxylase-like metal-dependent hydrolase (beta-lactamase superfamily II)
MRLMRKRFMTFLMAVFLIAAMSRQSRPQQDGIEITRPNDSVCILTGGFHDNNVTALKTSDGIVVIDSYTSPEAAAVVKDLIIEELGSDRFLYVINTHHHWDHSQGNQVFEEAAVVGHENCRVSMIKQAENPSFFVENNISSRNIAISEGGESEGSKKEDIPPPPPPTYTLLLDSPGFELTPPEITFRDELTIYCGDTTFDLIFFGTAHTDNDILIHVPEQKLLFVGDLFFKKSLPMISEYYRPDVRRWRIVREMIEERKDEITRVVPGHGEFMTAEDLMLRMDYLLGLWDGIAEYHVRGEEFDLVEKDFSLDRIAPEMVPLNIVGSSGGSMHRNNVRLIWEYQKP